MHTIVATFYDVWQDLICKFAILCHTPMLSTHTYMSLVDLYIFGHFSWPLIYKFISGIKVDSVKQLGVIILNHKSGPGWMSIHLNKFENLVLNFVK